MSTVFLVFLILDAKNLTFVEHASKPLHAPDNIIRGYIYQIKMPCGITVFLHVIALNHKEDQCTNVGHGILQQTRRPN